MLDDVIKNTLKFRHEQNGLFLRIHHTKPLTSSSLTSDEDGLASAGGDATRSSEKRLRFICVDIMSKNEAFAAVDEEDNIFIFHLTDKCFWQLPTDSKVRHCTAIRFAVQHNNKNYLLLGNKSGFIYEIEIDSGIVQRCIKAFAEPINQLLFSTFTLDSRSLVVSSCNQIKIYDENFRKKFEYSSKDSRIHLVKFIPGDETGRLAVVLCSNVICILSSSLRLIRHYDPVKARNKYVQRFRQKVEKLNYSESQPAEFVRRAHNVKLKSNADNVISSVTRDYSNGLVTDMSFSSDGRHLVVSFLDGFIMLCSTSLWDVRKLIKYPDGLYARQCDFMPFAMTTEQLNETTNKLLLTLTSNDELMLMSFVDLNAETLDSRNDTFNYAIAANGRLLLDVQRKGEVLVYNMESFLRQKSTAEAGVESTEKNGKHESNYQWNVELGRIQTKINLTIPIGRLLPILKEFNSYPDKYRPMIWKTILRLPLNYAAFSRLMCSGLHSCVDNLRDKFTFVDQRTQKSLLKLVSCLSHWTTIFGYVNYLPKFVLPFMKVCRGDLLMCFELVATLILNHCQLWFEFAPLQAPYNYFCLIEQVLAEADGELDAFYKSKGATPKIYAWPLMETAFAEVFDERQWFEVWDHIVSNEPYFMLFTIVAYSLTLKSIIMRAENVDEMENIFRQQSFVDVQKVMRRAYRLMSKCPTSIHPQRYMKPFAALLPGDYQKFQNFPKNIASDKLSEIDVIRAEQKVLDEKLNQMDCVEKAISSRLKNHLMDEEYTKRMREVESAYERALEQEEERILCTRKKLLLNTRKVREREYEMMIQGRQSAMRKQLELKENELNEMLRRLEKQRHKEEIELRLADETLKLNEIAIELKTFPLLDEKDAKLESRFEETSRQLEHQKQRLMSELEAISLLAGNNNKLSETTSNPVESTVGDEKELFSTSEALREVEELESNFQRIQDGFHEAIKNDKDKADYVQRMKQLEEASEILEKEIYEILSGAQ